MIRLKSEEGNLTIIAFVLLVVLTLIGVFATKTAQIDLQTAYNEVPYKQNFYIAEGGVNREAAELGRGMYPVSNVNSPALLATHASGACRAVHTKCSASPMSSPSDTWAFSRLRADTRPFISAGTITVWTRGPEGRHRPARFVSHLGFTRSAPKQNRKGDQRNERYDKESPDLQSDYLFAHFFLSRSLQPEKQGPVWQKGMVTKAAWTEGKEKYIEVDSETYTFLPDDGVKITRQYKAPNGQWYSEKLSLDKDHHWHRGPHQRGGP